MSSRGTPRGSTGQGNGIGRARTEGADDGPRRRCRCSRRAPRSPARRIPARPAQRRSVFYTRDVRTVRARIDWSTPGRERSTHKTQIKKIPETRSSKKQETGTGRGRSSDEPRGASSACARRPRRHHPACGCAPPAALRSRTARHPRSCGGESRGGVTEQPPDRKAIPFLLGFVLCAGANCQDVQEASAIARGASKHEHASRNGQHRAPLSPDVSCRAQGRGALLSTAA